MGYWPPFSTKEATFLRPDCGEESAKFGWKRGKSQARKGIQLGGAR